MRFINIFLILFLLLLPASFSQISLGPSCKDNVAFDSSAYAKCLHETELNSRITTLETNAQKITLLVKNSLTSTDLTGNNSLEILKNRIYYIAISLILLVFTYSGVIWITSSTDPQKREISKNYLINSFYMMIFVMGASTLTGMSADFSNQLVTSLNPGDQSNFFTSNPWSLIKSGNSNDLQSGFDKLSTSVPIFLLIGWAYLIFMYLRNILVVLFTVLSQLIIILFFFRPTKSFGKMFFTIYFIELLIPIIFYPIFTIAGSLMASTPDYISKIYIMSAALASALIVHVLLLILGVIKSSDSGRLNN